MTNPSTDRTSSGKRVLIVDDEPDVSAAIKLVLRVKGYAVEVVEDADAALRAFEAGKHDLIITDYALGTKTGLDLAQEIRGRFPTQPIILISAYAESLALRKERLSNVNVLLGKPFSLKEMDDALTSVFSNA